MSRAGVEASIRLSSIIDQTTWTDIESQYKDMLSKKKGGTELTELDTFCEELGKKLCSSKKENLSLSVEEFEKTIEWKFLKGKPRHALWKYIKSNSAKEVATCSQNAFHRAEQNDIKGAVNEFCKLKGIGPASASAYLSRFKPELFCFMDDEVIETLFNGKRGYTISIYLQINSRCQELADSLEGENALWTPARVGRALWTAARISAEGLPDLTKLLSDIDDSKKRPNKVDNTTEKDERVDEEKGSRGRRKRKKT